MTRPSLVSLFGRVGALAALSLCWAIPARAAEPADVEHQLLARAKSGDVEAEFDLGVLYSMGPSVRQLRPRDAEYWLRRADDQHHVGAMLQLVELYLTAPEFQADFGDIAPWLERAAALGHRQAASLLGMALWSGGKGIDMDRPRGFRFLRASALRGDETAALFLAERALDGVGLQRDPAKARQVLEFAARNGILRARQQLKVLPADARRLRRPAEIFHDLRKLADRGDAGALLLLGISETADPDYMAEEIDLSLAERRVRARHWLEQADALGQAEATTRLGILYANGQGVEPDSGKAAALFERASATQALAQLNLAVLILDRKLPAATPARAVALLTSASVEDPNAAFELGMIYYEGRFQPRDVPHAVALFEQAAHRNQPAALVNLGVIAANGENGPADLAAALKWWTLARLAGSREAGALIHRVGPRFQPTHQIAATALLRDWIQALVQARAAGFPDLALD